MSNKVPLALWRGVRGEASVQGQDNLTVGARLELVLSGIATANVLMVIDFAVDGQHLFAVGRIQRLASTLWIDDAQPLVGEDGRAATVYSTPVGSAVADLLTHLQCFLSQCMRLFLDV